MGFEFSSPNKGCEALSYSFISFLCRIVNEELTILNFTNFDMGKLKEKFPSVKFEQIRLKIKDPRFKMIRSFIKCDYVFDITMGDSFSDIYSKESCLIDIKFKKIANLFSKKYILMPQTYGPFTSEDICNKAKFVLRNAYSIMCRDETSQRYINDMFSVNNSVLTTDIAFLLPYDISTYLIDSDNSKLGINVSGLLWKGGFDNANQFGLKFSYKEYIEYIIGYYTNENFEIHLIPHVIDLSETAHDDDYNICCYLNKKYPNTILAPAFQTPIEAKSYIANMDCFIGARMHSTIAAFSAGVATIPFSYSRKFEGLYESLQYPYVIHSTLDSLEECIEKTRKYVSMAHVLKDDVQNRGVIINEKIRVFCDEILRIFNA
ncbi:MAG: hypothetical protein K0S41_2706 [Anaerocolumna sp.]|jgi:polysaccharide pyruvyl transferase WcaK-like protein|nr:hypothetical protein [Anaerocolumna sp.]